MSYQTTGLASAGLGVTRQQFVNGRPVSSYVDPNPATLVVPQIVPRPIALPPLVASNNWGHDDPRSLSFNGPPDEVGAWANAYAMATSMSAPFVPPASVPPPGSGPALDIKTPAGAAGSGSAPFLAPPAPRAPAISVVTNPPSRGLVPPGLPPTMPAPAAAPPLAGQPDITPPAGLPEDHPGHEVETFHDAVEDPDVAEEGIGGGDGEPAVIPGAIPEPAAPPLNAGIPLAPPPPPSGWHPGMRVVDAMHMPGMPIVPVVDTIAALSESAASTPTSSGAPSGSPGAASGCSPSVGAGASAATNAMLTAVLELNTAAAAPAMSPVSAGSDVSMDMAPAVDAALGIPGPPGVPPPPPRPPVRTRVNKNKGKAHPIPDQFAESFAAENGAFSGSAATGGRMDAQSELLNAIRSGGGLKPTGERKRTPYDRPKTAKDVEEGKIAALMKEVEGGFQLRKTAGPRTAVEDVLETPTGWKRLGAPKKPEVMVGDQPMGMDKVAIDMAEALRKRNAAMRYDDDEDEQGDRHMDDRSDEGEWYDERDIEMGEGSGASVDPNIRANMTAVAAAAAVAGRAARGTGSPIFAGAVPDFNSVAAQDDRAARGKFDQTVPEEDEGFTVQNMPSPPSTKKSKPAPPKGKKPKVGRRPS